MKKLDTIDDFKVYNIKKDNKTYYLANKDDYKKDIDNLLLNIDDLLFDSIIFIFGFDTGEYLPYLKKAICLQNKVMILEPNEEIFDIYSSEINDNNDNIKMIHYEEGSIKKILSRIISVRNFTNLYIHAFGNYEEIYKSEYDNFVSIVDNYYFNAQSSLFCNKRFKDVFLENILANLSQINNSSPLNSYIDSNVGIPAIIVSAGPSLDKNIIDMIKNKDKVEKSIVIAGNRTLKVLIDNNIKPDLVVSIDPIDANYDMMKNNLECDSFLAFYEYSNRYLLKDYKGEKIYISGIFSQIVEDLNDLKNTYGGGSVAHTCIDIARIMGCNPIILVGQDLAHTDNKAHANSTTFDIDKKYNIKRSYLTTKDVYGNDITTTATLDRFKVRLEEYINEYEPSKDYQFINCSYGAYIKGCEHVELNDVFRRNIFNNKKQDLKPGKSLNIDLVQYKNIIKEHVDEYIEKSNICINLCNELLDIKEDKDLVNIDEDDLDLQKFMYILDIVTNFENSSLSVLLGGYFSIFIYNIKNESFKMLAKDYDKYTSNLKYQSTAFLNYFKTLNIELNSVKKIIENTINEFY